MTSSVPPDPSKFGQVTVVQPREQLTVIQRLLGRKIDFSREEPLAETIANLRVHFKQIPPEHEKHVKKSYKLCRELNGDKPRKGYGFRSDHGILVGLELSAIGCGALGVIFGHMHDEGEEAHIGPVDILKQFGDGLGPYLVRSLNRITMPRYKAEGVLVPWADYRVFKELPKDFREAYKRWGVKEASLAQIDEEYLRFYRKVYVPGVYNAGTFAPQLVDFSDASLAALIIVAKLIDAWHNLGTMSGMKPDERKWVIRKYLPHVEVAAVINADLHRHMKKEILKHLRLFDKRNEADRRALVEIEAALMVNPVFEDWIGTGGVYPPLPDYRLPLTYDVLLGSPAAWLPVIVPYRTKGFDVAQVEFPLALRSELGGVQIFSGADEPFSVLAGMLSKRVKYRDRHGEKPELRVVESVLPQDWRGSAIVEVPYHHDLDFWHMRALLEKMFKSRIKPVLEQNRELAASAGFKV